MHFPHTYFSSFTLQVDELTEVQKAVRENMQRGDSPWSVVFMFTGMVGIVALTYFLSKYAGSWEMPFRKKSPHPFFLQVLKKLGLTTTQRKWLERLVVDLHLKQPTKILLSPNLFDESVCEWNRRGYRRDSKLTPSDQAENVSRLRDYLFPVATNS